MHAYMDRTMLMSINYFNWQEKVNENKRYVLTWIISWTNRLSLKLF